MNQNKSYIIEIENENLDTLFKEDILFRKNQNNVLKNILDKFSEEAKIYWKVSLQKIFKENHTTYINEQLWKYFCMATEVILFRSRTFVKKELQDKEHYSDIKTDFLLEFKEKNIYKYLKSFYDKQLPQSIINVFNAKQNILNIEKGYIRNGKVRKDGFHEKELCLIGYCGQNLLYLKYHHSCNIDNLKSGQTLSLDSCSINNQNKTLQFNIIYKNENQLNMRKLMQKMFPDKAYNEFDLQDFNSYFNTIQYDELDELIESVKKEDKKS